MIFKNLSILVDWTKVASALEGLSAQKGGGDGILTRTCGRLAPLTQEVSVLELSLQFIPSEKLVFFIIEVKMFIRTKHSNSPSNILVISF